MLDHFHKRFSVVERELEKIIAAPTFPIYDTSDLPDDVINGQIGIGTGGSINWFIDDIWNTAPGTLSTVGNLPQDVVEGQIAIGSDNSLNWFVNGNWYGIAGVPASGNPPQDAVDGQIAIGNGSLVWYVGSWYGFTS